LERIDRVIRFDAREVPLELLLASDILVGPVRDPDQGAPKSVVIFGSIARPHRRDTGGLRHTDIASEAVPHIERIRGPEALLLADVSEELRVRFPFAPGYDPEQPIRRREIHLARWIWMWRDMALERVEPLKAVGDLQLAQAVVCVHRNGLGVS